jgi:uncharacterized protein
MSAITKSKSQSFEIKSFTDQPDSSENLSLKTTKKYWNYSINPLKPVFVSNEIEFRPPYFYSYSYKDNITVEKSKFGQGLFATKDIPEGSLLFLISGRQISYDQALMLGERESHPIQIGADTYILSDFPFYFCNHSCDPNCAVTENLEFITIKKIKKGDELFWDYSTSMLERHWTMKCGCGSPFCRKQITDFDLLPKEIQEKYIKLKIVQPYIKVFIDNFNQNGINSHLNVICGNHR